MLGKIEGREKGMTEDEMIGWPYGLNGHESEQALGVGDGQGGLAWLQSMELQRIHSLEKT